MTVKLTKAVFNSVPKTKFLHVHGLAEVESPEDELQVSIAEPQGINEAILLLNLTCQESDGFKKPQSLPFSFSTVIFNKLKHKQVQIEYNGKSDIIDIEVI